MNPYNLQRQPLAPLPDVGRALQPINNALMQYRQSMDARTKFQAQEEERQRQEAARQAAASRANRGMDLQERQFDATQKFRNAQLGMDRDRMGMDRKRFRVQKQEFDEKKEARALDVGGRMAQSVLDKYNSNPQEADSYAQKLFLDPRLQTFVRANRLDVQTPQGRKMAMEFLQARAGLYKTELEKAALSRKQRPSPTELKATYSAQDELPALQSTIQALTEAGTLVDQAYSGTGALTRSQHNLNAPSILPNVISSPERSAATVRLNQIMSEQAIGAMSQALKGATTDTEMQAFREMIADPNVPPDLKRKSIQALQQRAINLMRIKQQRVQELGGRVPDFSQGGPITPGGTANAPAETKTLNGKTYTKINGQWFEQ